MPPIRIEPWSNRSSRFWEGVRSRSEELLSLMHEELDGDGPLEEQVADAFERGLQLGLMVGLGSSELAVPPKAAGTTEGSAPVSR